MVTWLALAHSWPCKSCDPQISSTRYVRKPGGQQCIFDLFWLYFWGNQYKLGGLRGTRRGEVKPPTANKRTCRIRAASESEVKRQFRRTDLKARFATSGLYLFIYLFNALLLGVARHIYKMRQLPLTLPSLSWRGSSRINSIQFNSIQSNPIQSNPIQFNSIQFNSIQSNPIQSNLIKFN